MNTKQSITRTAVLFIALAAAGIIIASGAKFLAEGVEQTIMVGTGSAVFGAGLTFFLIRIIDLNQK